MGAVKNWLDEIEQNLSRRNWRDALDTLRQHGHGEQEQAETLLWILENAADTYGNETREKEELN